MRKLVMLLFLVTSFAALHAVEQTKPAIYIESQDGFETYLAAAMTKKEVPADVVTDKEKAAYVLKASSVAAIKNRRAGR